VDGGAEAEQQRERIEGPIVALPLAQCRSSAGDTTGGTCVA